MLMSTPEIKHLEDHMNRLFLDLRADINEKYLSKSDASERYVKWRTFAFVGTLGFSIVMATLGGIWTAVIDGKEEMSGIEQSVAELNGKLAPFDFTQAKD